MADPDLVPKPLLAKLREQQPDLKAAAKEVREALMAVQAESEAAKAAAARSEPRLLRLRQAAVRDVRRPC